MEYYNSEDLYIGNIIKIENGQKKVLEQQVKMLYNPNTDAFIIEGTLAWKSIFEISNPFANLTEKEINILDKRIDTDNISYKIEKENVKYVDKETIINISKK